MDGSNGCLLLYIAIQQFIPTFRFHNFQQGLVDRFAERTVLLQGDAHEIFIESAANDLYPAGKLCFYNILQDFFILHKRVDCPALNRRQSFLYAIEWDYGDSLFGQKGEALRSGDTADARMVKVIKAVNLASQLGKGQLRRDGRRKAGDKNN